MLEKFWINATILKILPNGFIAKTDDENEVLFHTDRNLVLNVNEKIQILCDDIMTLSLLPQRKAYEVKRGEKHMLFNLVEMKEKFKSTFTKRDLAQLEAIENVLRYKVFNEEEVIKLGNTLYQKAKPRGPVAIRITRESDQLPLFQMIMEGKSQRHLDFGEAKRQTVLKTGHCSMWALLKETVDGGLDEIFTENSPCLPGSGGFPIYENNQLVATVFVSGLHEGQDQLVLIEALSEVLNVEVPEYNGFIF